MKVKLEPFTPGCGTVVDLDIHGRGIVKDLGVPVFLPDVVLGDRVRYHVTGRRRKLWEGEPEEILTPSRDRVPSSCPYFPRCGGCDLLTTDYRWQLKWKREKVQGDLERIGGFQGISVKETVGSSSPTGYRNHMQFKVQEGRIGLFERGSRDLVEVENCLIAGPSMNRVLRRLTGHLGLKDLTQLSLRENLQGEVMILYSLKPGRKLSHGFLSAMMEPPVISIYEGLAAKGKGHFEKSFRKVWEEKPFQEKILGINHVLSPGAFFQVNTRQGEKLYEKALGPLNLGPRDRVLDLYCGLGTMTLYVAKEAKEVLGVEYVEEGVEGGRKTAEREGIRNVSFAHGKVEDILEKILEEDFNKCILDPPREGCHPKILELLKDSSVETITYISCNPSTQARDLKLLKSHFHLESVTPVDMFCHSLHVETVALMSRK